MKIPGLNHSSLREFNFANITTGVIASVLAMTGPPAIILEAAKAGNFSIEQTAAWMFAAYFFGGLISIILPFWLRIPITGAHSITGAMFLVSITPNFHHTELIGCFIISGLIVFAVGITGTFSKMMTWFPKEVIAAMLAGMVGNYMIRLIPAIGEMPLVGISALLIYLIFKTWIVRVPAGLAAILTAVIVLASTNSIVIPMEVVHLVTPSIKNPEFHLLDIVTVAVPLALLILSNDIAPGISALIHAEYDPPIRKIVSVSGLVSMVSALFGSHCANVAGMMTMITAGKDAGVKAQRYIASIISGVILLMFSLFSWKLVPLIQVLPRDFVTILASVALIGVCSSSLQTGFSNSGRSMSALFTFLIVLSNVSFLHISAAVWALMIGAFISKVFEADKRCAQN